MDGVSLIVFHCARSKEKSKGRKFHSESLAVCFFTHLVYNGRDFAMDHFFKNSKSQIGTFLENFLKRKQDELKTVNHWGEDVPQKFSAFLEGGKMIRGSLVLLSHHIGNGTNPDDALRVASSMELFHSSFLIHDDMIDRDLLRRGKPTIHQQYGGGHFGTSMAMCIGDIGFFLGFELLSELTIEPQLKNTIIATCAKELIKVGLGEMQDVAFSQANGLPSYDEILAMYRYKTARYTFSLPFILGAILARQDDKTREKLEELGEYLGLLFQIKDDELGMFGDSKETGKPVGSDLKECKKTIFVSLLGKNYELPTTLGELQTLIISSGVKAKVDTLIEEYKQKSLTHIVSLKISNEDQRILLSLVDYLEKRKK